MFSTDDGRGDLPAAIFASLRFRSWREGDSSTTPTSRRSFPGRKYTRDKFTFQLSDYLPVWIQIKTDIEGFPLNQIVQEGKE